MIAYKITIENYRLLKTFSIDLEKELSLVIGKNNTGKTSILSILNKFLSQSDKNKFSFNDFNIDFKSYLKNIIENNETISEEEFEEVGIKLRVFIEYDENDNLSNVSRVMMDLDPDNNIIVLGFEYLLEYNEYLRVRTEYGEFKTKENSKNAENTDYQIRGLYDYLNSRHIDFFKTKRKSIFYDRTTESVNEGNYIDLDKEKISIQDIINFKFISAKRDVANKELNHTLSAQTSRIYKRTETNEEQNEAVEDFKDKLSETDSHLSEIYKTLFEKIVERVRDFGGVKINDSEIEIISTLQHRELLEGNTTVVYNHDEENQLPEYYNGLGYMNLISMIFEIEILVNEFKRDGNKKPADINLLFIEEPEAHTHPQMQYVFIKNIKKLLNEGIRRDDGEHRKLQTIISTHSSCIVADSDFDDIKYLKKDESRGVSAKNLKELKHKYDTETNQYQFLKQYLTISRAEIFFADKAILIEGDTERILIPTMMKKVDIEEEKWYAELGRPDENLALLSQNISVIEVGAYSQIFEKFIAFLGIKSLIITDLDSTDGEGGKCPVAEGVNYSNDAIRFFFDNSGIDDLKGYNITEKVFQKVDESWTRQDNGELCIVYQTNEGGYTGRSFEDAFIHVNREFVNINRVSFQGLKNREYFDDEEQDAYVLAADCIKKKTHFALDIIYHSNVDLSNWDLPAYIKEGLLWLKKD